MGQGSISEELAARMQRNPNPHPFVPAINSLDLMDPFLPTTSGCDVIHIRSSKRDGWYFV